MSITDKPIPREFAEIKKTGYWFDCPECGIENCVPLGTKSDGLSAASSLNHLGLLQTTCHQCGTKINIVGAAP